MSNRFPLKICQLLRVLPFFLFGSLLLNCPVSQAAQRATVIADQATIFSDRQMSSPIGFVTKGKVLTIGEIPRNRAQVYPIIVSGKVAYIRVLDVRTEGEDDSEMPIVTKRFQKQTVSKRPQSRVALSFFNFSSVVGLGDRNGELEDQDSLTWQGLSFRTEVLLKNGVDIFIIGNMLQSSFEEEEFRIFELGAGVGYRLLDFRYVKLRTDAQVLAIPFATYALSDEFRVRSYGVSSGANLHLAILLGKHWGLEAYSGFYYTRLAGFNSPDPYQDVAPSFYGVRLGGGLNVSFE